MRKHLINRLVEPCLLKGSTILITPKSIAKFQRSRLTLHNYYFRKSLLKKLDWLCKCMVSSKVEMYFCNCIVSLQVKHYLYDILKIQKKLFVQPLPPFRLFGLFQLFNFGFFNFGLI